MALGTTSHAPKHWVYLDAGRTHELHAQAVLRDEDGLLVTTEFPAGSRDPSEVVRAQTRVRGEAELATLLAEIEDRLAHTGRYFRTEAHDPHWTPLAGPKRPIDLRAHEATIPGGEMTGARMRFHHFHASDHGEDRLLISMPRPGMSGRHVLAQMTFEFPNVDAGELEVLHSRLAPAVLASVVAKEHVEAPRKGLRKLFEARDYENAFGAKWAERASVMFKKATARFVDAPAAPEPPVPHLAHPVPGDLDAMKHAIAHARIESIRARYLDPVTEAQLVEGGEHVIRRYVNKIRLRASHERLYELSLLEATLLCEYAIPARMWDLASDEGAKILRYLNGRA